MLGWLSSPCCCCVTWFLVPQGTDRSELCTGQVHLHTLRTAGCPFTQPCCVRQVHICSVHRAYAPEHYKDSWQCLHPALHQAGACGLQLTCQNVYSSKDCCHLDGGPSKSRTEEGQRDTCQAWAACQSCMSAEGCECSMPAGREASPRPSADALLRSQVLSLDTTSA